MVEESRRNRQYAKGRFIGADYIYNWGVADGLVKAHSYLFGKWEKKGNE